MAGTLREEIGKKGPFESPEQEVALNCMRTADCLGQSALSVLRTGDLSGAQYNVLRILRGAGSDGLGCQEIARRMITRDPDLTRLLDRLEKRGLVRRARQTDDRRVVRTTITEQALTLLATLDEPMQKMHRQILGHLAPERLALLNELLELARKPAEVLSSPVVAAPG